MKKVVMLVVMPAVMLLPLSTQAQYRDRRHDDEWGGRISSVITDCDHRTDDFKQALARALDRSRLEGSRREDELNADARQLARALDRLRDSWNHDHDRERSRRHVRSAISAGRDINRTMVRHELRGRVQGEWDALKTELNHLAEVFEEPTIRWER